MKRLIRAAAWLTAALFSPVTWADTYVLVHGAWGGGWTYKALDEQLSAQGHTVYRPTLTGLGEREHLSSPDITLETHIEDVINLILYEDLHEVTLLGHSYGGMVITGVADRIPGRIRRMVYLDAVVPGDGESLVDIHAKAAAAMKKLARDGFAMFPRDTSNDPPPKNVPQPLRTVTDKLHLQKKEKSSIVTAYILTVAQGQDAAMDDFAPQAARARERAWRVVQMTGDHNVQRSAPEALAAVLRTLFDES